MAASFTARIFAKLNCEISPRHRTYVLDSDHRSADQDLRENPFLYGGRKNTFYVSSMVPISFY